MKRISLPALVAASLCRSNFADAIPVGDVLKGWTAGRRTPRPA